MVFFFTRHISLQVVLIFLLPPEFVEGIWGDFCVMNLTIKYNLSVLKTVLRGCLVTGGCRSSTAMPFCIVHI